jgi:ATP-dependent Lon protease
MHGYIPGWEIPKITPASIAQGVGFVIDYFGEVLAKFREESFADRVRDVPLHPGVTRRDMVAVERITSGMMKIIYPDGNTTPEELQEVVAFACELRQRVHNQLCVIAPGEFREKFIAPAALATGHETPDLQRRAINPTQDPLNSTAMLGASTGLAVLEQDGKAVGGELILIQVSAINGSPGLTVTGIHGKALRDSIQAVYNLIRSRFRDFGVAESRITSQQIAVHLVKISQAKDGPSAGLAFLVGIVSALANKKVKPGFAFTGEVALHGEVSAVGGLVPKMTAAAHAGRTKIIYPASNGDISGQLPADVRSALTLHPVSTAAEALALALES